MKKIGKVNLKGLEILNDNEMKNIQGGYNSSICFGSFFGISSGAVYVCGSREYVEREVGTNGTYCCGCENSHYFCE